MSSTHFEVVVAVANLITGPAQAQVRDQATQLARPGVVVAVQALIPIIKAQGSGSIVNVASVAGACAPVDPRSIRPPRRP